MVEIMVVVELPSGGSFNAGGGAGAGGNGNDGGYPGGTYSDGGVGVNNSILGSPFWFGGGGGGGGTMILIQQQQIVMEVVVAVEVLKDIPPEIETYLANVVQMF